ncbi:uncharacterized protein [Diadema setosum]|uniref:uncharacterized protein n=1 Tax=Diadema setosum TaxID=31175 RepID=UPI003B3B906C
MGERPGMGSVNKEVEEPTTKKEGADQSSSTTKSTVTKPVKIKVEVVPEDEEDFDRECDEAIDNEAKALSASSDQHSSRPFGSDDERAGEKKSSNRPPSETMDDLDDFHSPQLDHDDGASDDFNQQDRYSPFDGMCELSECDDFTPIQDRDGNVVLEVDCGANSALLYVNKLCQGSKGQCIFFEDRWYTPNEFQFISGRETAKDWKRSIRHRGKSLKILMGRGLLRAHPLMCECDTCRLNFASKGLRLGDRRVALPPAGANNIGSLAVMDRSRLRRSNGHDNDGGHLNEIIDQLQHRENGYNQNGHHSYDGSRKRPLNVDNGSPTTTSPPTASASSSTSGLALVKRARSISPREDDIYDEQQRRIFEAANSPEPQNIENLRRSLNLSTSRSSSPLGRSSSPGGSNIQSFYGGGGSGGLVRAAQAAVMASASIANGTSTANAASVPADLSRNSSASPPSGAAVGSSGVVLMSQPPLMIAKHQTKSRKQTAPQHLDVGGAREEAHPQRAPHIVLSSHPSQSYTKVNAAIRPRYQSTPGYGARNTATTNGIASAHHGSSGELNLSTNGSSSSRRSHSAASPSLRQPGTPVKMIELTRPEIVASSSSGYSSSRPSSTHSSNHPGDDGNASSSSHPSSGHGDTVFLPADMASWSVSDVTHFVQSLKGCEEYSQVFCEQAIDGEILPVLTEDHLLHNMGLKLGPALKIRLHVARRLGFTLDGQYCSSTVPPPQPAAPPSTGPPPAAATPLAGQKSTEVFTDDVH